MFRLPIVVILFGVGCGSKSEPAPTTPTSTSSSKADAEAAKAAEAEARRETARRTAISNAHRKLQVEQQEALAATCETPKPKAAKSAPTSLVDKHPRCLPSCYATEPIDPRAGKKLRGPVAITHAICQRGAGDEGPFLISPELDGGRPVRPARGRFPKPHKKGSWQAKVVQALVAALPRKLPRTDVIVIAGNWRDRPHPLTKEPLRCVAATHYTRSIREVAECGTAGVACEATGNAAARGINVVHYRLAEARQLQSAGKSAECQQAALEAIAVARGLPRWRQYAQLNVGKWPKAAAYRTRFDGILDEETLFSMAASLGAEAEQVHAACGGATTATTPAQEQSFHTCW